jgi:hypothetical protein
MNNKTAHPLIWLVPFLLLFLVSACTINFGSTPTNPGRQNQEEPDDAFDNDNDDDDGDDDRD